MHHLFSGRSAPLSTVPGHLDVEGITRMLLLTAADRPGLSFHIACHEVTDAGDAREGVWRYASLEAHPHDEINLLIPGPAGLAYQYEVAGRVFRAEAPATVIIPSGDPHRMEVLSGSGIFVCLRLDGAASSSVS